MMICGLAVYVVLPVFLALGILRKYRESKWGKCGGGKSLQGKVFIVTGANSGIGKETVRELVRRNARVIMACRDIPSAKKAINDIRKCTQSGDMIPLYLDLESIDSIKTFANIVLHDFPKIHVLINNAGLSMPPTATNTDDRFEIHFQVNYLGHFVLTKLLLDRLKESAPSRIIIVSSTLHEHGRIEFSDLTSSSSSNNTTTTSNGHPRHRNQLYCNSKLMNAYQGLELVERLRNTGVSTYVVCPGFCKTRLMRYSYSSIKWYQWPILLCVAFFFMRSANQGCQTIVYCSIVDELQQQNQHWFYRDCAKYFSTHHFNSEISTKLWNLSEHLTKDKLTKKS